MMESLWDSNIGARSAVRLARQKRKTVACLHRRISQSKNLVHALREVAGGFDVGCLVAGLLRNPPTLVTGAVQRSDHSGPVGATVEQFRTVAPGARRGRRGAEVFDVDSHDAFAEHLNPSLGRTVIAAASASRSEGLESSAQSNSLPYARGTFP